MELSFRLVRHRKAVRILKRLLLPEAFLIYLLVLFRPFSLLIYPRHEILLHTLFFVFYLPGLFFLILALYVDRLSKIFSLAILIITFITYYIASLAQYTLGYLFALSLGPAASLYIATYPARNSIETLGFVGFELKAPKQAFRYIRDIEILLFILLTLLFAIFRTLWGYLASLAIFLILRRHFLKPIDVVKALAYSYRYRPKKRLKPALVLPAEPRAYVVGALNNIGLLAFLILIDALLALSKSLIAYEAIVFGSFCSGVAMLASYTVYYTLKDLEAYLVSISLSERERLVIVGL